MIAVRCIILTLCVALSVASEAGAAASQTESTTSVLCPSLSTAIRPGDAIGPIGLEMTIGQATQALHVRSMAASGMSLNGRPVGPNGEFIPMTPDRSWTWTTPPFRQPYYPGLQLTTRGDRIVMISLSGNAGLALAVGHQPAPSPFAGSSTEKGLHFGDTKDEVRRIYGPPPSTNDTGGITYWVYNSLGLLVGFDWVTAGTSHSPITVTTIAVFALGRFCEAADARAHIIGGTALDENFTCRHFSPPP